MNIYGDIVSGNCYKVALTLNLLNIKHHWIHIDILAGDTKKEDFLIKNPQGKIPILELDDGKILKESNAIINFLAKNSFLIPKDDFLFAQVLQWQFFEQYSHEPYLAVARFIKHYLGLPEKLKTKYESKLKPGYAALQILENELTKNDFLVGNSLTVADVSLYPYTRFADQGGFDLTEFKALKKWFERIESSPNYLDIFAK